MSENPSLTLIPVDVKTVGDITSVEEVLASFRQLDRLAPYEIFRLSGGFYRATYPEDEATGAARYIELIKIDNVSFLGRNVYRIKSLVLAHKNGSLPVSVDFMASIQNKKPIDERDIAMEVARFARRLIIPSIYLAKDGIDPKTPISVHAGNVQQALISIAAQHILKIGIDEPIDWQFAPFSSKRPFLQGRYLGSNQMADAEIDLLQDAPHFLMMIVTITEKKIAAELFDSDASYFSRTHLTKPKDPMTVMGEIQMIESIVSDARCQRDKR
ncbi:MAG: hypothetical protein CL472_09190 [Acidobacteria bacterium]|nr:hypothetical protein [Acidobacteriota bacterium]